MSTIILIPSRLASTRLPNKPLAEIGGIPMVVHVLRRAEEAGLGPVYVATDSTDIQAVVEQAGGSAIMTHSDHPSGSDRIAEALEIVDPKGTFDRIVNLQGDFPDIEPQAIIEAAELLDDPSVEIGTLVAEITDPYEKTAENVVKAVATPIDETRMRALYFTRATAPFGDGPLYHHIGLYAFRRSALKRFVSLKPTPLEKRESLEQLRALENGMRIDVAVVDHVPLGVDTPESLERVRKKLRGAQS
ncbi:MAG: 3-deoxy-manno-octulosonate cytidylyltransferase [Pseudomonadota bacterium]